MKPRKKAFFLTVLIFGLAAAARVSPRETAPERPVPAFKAVDATASGERPAEAVLARPVALAFDDRSILVADAQDCAIKIFDKNGRFVRAIGRKGSGPGEFSFPSGVGASAGRIFVADKFNFRVQILDAEGAPAGGFRVGFPPDKIYPLGGRVLVTSNPSGRPVREQMLHLFDESGALLWAGLETRLSGDPVYDSFRNMVLVCPADPEGFFVVFRCDERSILRVGVSGGVLGSIPVDDRYVFKPVRLPFRGPRTSLQGFCWSAAFDQGRLYLLEPEAEDGRDLGPGRRLSVLGRDGRMAAVIDLPRRVHRIAVDGERIYATDEDGELGVFEVVR